MLNLYETSSSSDEENDLLANIFQNRRKEKRIRERVNHMEYWDEEEFFIRFRLTKDSVRQLLDIIVETLETATNRNAAITPITQLLLALRYYATGSMLIVVGDFCGVHKSTASRMVKKVSEAIASLRNRFINFPQDPHEIDRICTKFYEIARFPRVIGTIDCTHIKIQSPGGDQAENFRNRKGYYSFNVQTICDGNLCIRDIVARWPGSSHDQTIFNASSIKAKFDRGDMQNKVLLGDSGYGLSRYLITPLPNPILPQEILFQEALLRTRYVVERSYGVWKRRFPILSLGIKLDYTRVQAVIVACAVLHNIAVLNGENEPPLDRAIRDNFLQGIQEANIPNGLGNEINENGANYKKETECISNIVQV
ncbi:putative nuclease HARBI1 [Anoplophora glabripennis]|uniref:putative nuclease HARBI1 n=1 Tax=Anoplophora glabripennis TaxID=217634 RepID=UPI000C774DBD|nr:putative nuclease HARBI1 [Anoplophora glabripennis]